MKIQQILMLTKGHYNDKIIKYGPNFKGVDWGTDEGQKIRFETICQKLKISQISSIIDYGCGYGEFFSYIKNKKFNGLYQGYDISKEMIKQAKIIYKNDFDNFIFTSKYSDIKPAEYCIASGVFNIKLITKDFDWLKYIKFNLEKINKVSKKGFIFNMFEKNKNENKLYNDVFYINPIIIKKYCLMNFSNKIELFKNYYRNDFTIFVKK